MKELTTRGRRFSQKHRYKRKKFSRLEIFSRAFNLRLSDVICVPNVFYVMRKIRITLFAITLVSLAIGQGYRSFFAARIDEAAALREIAPAAEFSSKRGTPARYSSPDGSVAFNSYDVAPEIRGYAGPIKVMLVLDSRGFITGIKLLEHCETKNYVQYMEMPSYLSRFLGKRVTDPFEVDKDIDSITRATVSVEALAKTVKESSRRIAADSLGINVKNDDSKSGGWSWIWPAFLFAFAGAGHVLTRRSPKFHRLRDATLITGFLVIGLYLSSPFSILHVFNLLMFRPSSSPVWYVIVGGALLSVIFAGRFYCGWICPWGALSEFIGRLPFRKWTIPVEMDRKGRQVKYGLLGLITVLVLTTGRADYGNYETYLTLFSFHGNFFSWTLVAVTLLAGIRIERFWCRYLCPVAALTGALSRNEPGYPGRTGCPMGNRTNPETAECIRCNKCFRRNAEAPNE